MEPTDETGVVARIKDALKKAYPSCWVVKIHGDPMQESGIPDLIMCVDGLFVGLEVKHQKPRESLKHAKDRATALQLEQLARIDRAGGGGGVVTTVAEALAVVEAALAHHREYVVQSVLQ